MTNEEPAAARLPIVVGSDGQPYTPCASVAMLLRAIAESCRILADDPECGLDSAAAAIDMHADALEVRAVVATK